ncbi:hypothetical protein GCM10010317_079770 [Streptomyces mirabilis]|uniref:hypothetical protein n=1 Tax=Streptomyces mirabilis TaxID=68239 RepID=UPI00167E1B7C|nr:hypothetical protein [Streptomyces mirabilis]GHD71265.1 hypothetical protein GCM10010317_079770 [Streptomyces mirabilis]
MPEATPLAPSLIEGSVKSPVKAQPPWLPPEGTLWHVQAGTHFDAVRTGRTLGAAALALLGDASGAVICDPWSRIYYFLTEPSSTTGWDVRETTACGAATYVVVPPLNSREMDLHWVVRPPPDRPFTPTYQLRQVLQTAVDAQYGPRTEHSR